MFDKSIKISFHKIIQRHTLFGSPQHIAIVVTELTIVAVATIVTMVTVGHCTVL